MKLFGALLLSVSGMLFAQNLRDINLNMPINYETTSVNTSGQSPASPKGKGFNYELVLSTLGYALAYGCYAVAMDHDNEARVLSQDRSYTSEREFMEIRDDIKDHQRSRNLSASLSGAFVAGATFFLVKYIID